MLQAQVVDYICQCALALAAVFAFASLLAWMEGRPWLAVALFALARPSKEECAAFPLAPWPLDACLIPNPAASRSKRWAPLAAMFALSLAAGLRTVYVAAATPGTQAVRRPASPHCITCWPKAPCSWRYLRLFAIPYAHLLMRKIRTPRRVAGRGKLARHRRHARRLWRPRRDLAVWVTAAALLLLPSSSIFPAADVAADRRMYLACLPWPHRRLALGRLRAARCRAFSPRWWW